MNKLVICGEGGLGHEVLDLVLQLQKIGIKSYDEILFLDEDPDKKGYMEYKTFPSYEVYKTCDKDNTKFVIAIGEPAYRIKLIKEIKAEGFGFETLIHPAAYIGLNTMIGDGTVVQRGAIISCDCKIGKNCFFQAYSSIGHDCILRDNCTISTNAAVSGGVAIGENTYIAVGSSVKQGIMIGSDTVIGMGSIVTRDIPDNVIAIGNPARPMKHKDDTKVFKR